MTGVRDVQRVALGVTALNETRVAALSGHSPFEGERARLLVAALVRVRAGLE